MALSAAERQRRYRARMSDERRAAKREYDRRKSAERRADPEKAAADYAKQREWKFANIGRTRELNRESAARMRALDPERQRKHSRDYRSRNRASSREAERAWRERMGADAPNRKKKRDQQRATQAAATRSRRRWTPEEEAIALVAPTIAEAAFALGRSRYAIEERRRYLKTKETSP